MHLHSILNKSEPRDTRTDVLVVHGGCKERYRTGPQRTHHRTALLLLRVEKPLPWPSTTAMNHSRNVILRRLRQNLNSIGNHGTTSKEKSLAAMGLVAGAGTAATLVAYQHDSNDDNHEEKNLVPRLSAVSSTFFNGTAANLLSNSTTTCEKEGSYVPPGYSEPEAFKQCLEFHRSQLDDYKYRWDYQNTKIPTSTAWPQNIPSENQVSTLETDFMYCTRSPNYRSDETYCDNLQFRIATYYIQRTDDEILQQKGFKSIKDLAERGHANGMCYYGIAVNDGRVPGVDANPVMAVFWWRRCVELYNHVPSVYELAVALYTGEGVAEDETKAFHYFRQAANTGHAPAAYMLGDCLLDGVGCVRDRAEALDWLVTAADLGHRGARSRVMAVLERKDESDYGAFTDASRQTFSEDVADDGEQDIHKWAGDDEPTDGSPKRPVSIERRFTIGGGSGNPVVLARRKTLVDESRNL